MIIDIIVILKLYLIFVFNRQRGCPSDHYIPLDNLYIIDEPIRSITITLFIINFMNNLILFN